jgi:excisionase family DNA binding protein
MWKTPDQMAKLEGVSRMTINRWVRSGKYKKTQQTKGGHWRIWAEEPTEAIGYIRVSSSKQKSSLTTQKEIIERHYKQIRIVSDIGSGFNFKRPSFKAILERVMQGSATTIVVTTQDRLTRTGFKFIEWIVELHGGKIIALEHTNKIDGFDTETLISFITSFINSYYGKRCQKRKGSKKDSGFSSKRNDMERSDNNL